MKSKEFYGLTWLAFVTSFLFVLIAIWNSDWILVEKGFYTICLGWITFSAFSLVKTIRDKSEGIRTSPFYILLAWGSAVASFGIGMIAIWNTEWILVEKGYYWMGILFVTYTSFALSKELRDREGDKVSNPEYYSNKKQDLD